MTIVNTVDDAVLDPSFCFTNNSVLGPSVERSRDEFRIGCECTDAEDCQYRGCHCLQDMEEEDDDYGLPRTMTIDTLENEQYLYVSRVLRNQ